MMLTPREETSPRPSLASLARVLCPLLLGGLGACAATRTSTRPVEADTAPTTQLSATPPATSDTTSAGAAVSSASAPPPPAQVKRVPPPTSAQLAGTCSVGAPVTIGTSTVSDGSGPNVTIAASSEGVVASWSSRDEEITTIALDAAGRPRGEGRTMAALARGRSARLWELGDGKLVLAFRGKRTSPGSDPPSFLQRVDASGELVGSPVAVPFEDIRVVTPWRDQLLVLNSSSEKQEVLRVTATPGGLDVKRGASLTYHPDSRLHESMVATSDGGVWMFHGNSSSRDATSLHREEGQNVKVTLPRDFDLYPVPGEDGEPLWLNCSIPSTVKAVKLHEGKVEEVTLPRRACDEDAPARWRVTPDDNLYDSKNRGILFKKSQSVMEDGLHLTREPREFWTVASTWTGTSVLAIYATRKRGAWAVLAHPITCGASAPSAPSATGASRTAH